MGVNFEFDAGLSGIDHFVRYPAMLPFVGAAYRAADHRPTLLLGESHYFPEESTAHLDASNWYASSQAGLTAEEAAWVDCRGIVTCSWSSPGHKIFRELNRCLEETGVAFPDRGISTVAFMNAFQRPAAVTGGSMKGSFTQTDRTRSLEVVTETVRVLTPELVVITSRFAWAVFGSTLRTTFPDLRVEAVCHPASQFHWHVGRYPHGRTRFMAILRTQFVTSPGP